jgi:tetratricopeptide (TPR) repeat protein
MIKNLSIVTLSSLLFACTLTTERENPQVQRLHLQRAMQLEQEQKFKLAEEHYKDVRNKNLQSAPDIAAFAEWRLSYTAEALGDDLRALSHVASAENLKQSLPVTIRLAEIPARKAILYHKLGQFEQAYKATQSADQGLEEILSGAHAMRPQDAELCEMYYNMGAATAYVLDDQTPQSILMAQKVSQKYLLQSMQFHQHKHAKMAADLLLQNMNSLWNWQQTFPDRRTQIDVAAQLLELVQISERYLNISNRLGPLEVQVKTQVTLMKNKINDFIYSNKEFNILTEESKQLRMRR